MTCVCLLLVVSEYNSEGRCRDNCTTVSYAFGVIQNFNCWCSNTVPARSSLKSTTDCNMPCPGYPSDWCGGSDIFAYIALGKSPSSTEDGDNTPPATTPVSASEQTSTSVSKQTTTHVCIVVMLLARFICLYSFLLTSLAHLFPLVFGGPSLQSSYVLTVLQPRLWCLLKLRPFRALLKIQSLSVFQCR